ncbi:hypothetical protein FAZ15_16185 [Sphingobacterium olei]|uniref:Uncharacterized protein n=1 Tax=Sphingobacterium olei TaxID=2571155 RepID=A0A4U0NHA1_9SPHI|nr:hypothetical protein [Sphingobacterium olei]TJZ53577.1 hypothetical protein FAZ15_16185 [Sphingobacterium olei]
MALSQPLIEIGGIGKLTRMKKVRIEYPIVAFLFAYLNQIDLSLDRSRWEPLENLREYYKTQISPGKVAEFLVNKFDLKADKLRNLIFIKEAKFLAKIENVLLLYFRKKVFLTEDEMYFLCQKLFELSKYLRNDIEVHRLQIEKLRIEFSQLNYGVIKFKLTKKERAKAMNIEHFLQNEILHTIKIENFSKNIDI